MKKPPQDKAPKTSIPEIEPPSVISSSTREWTKLEPKMSKEFKRLMFEYLVNQYMFEIFSPGMTGKEYGALTKSWEEEATKCNIIKNYPFERDIFQHTHPMADGAKSEALRRKSRPKRDDCP
jgi:hypothetical protein